MSDFLSATTPVARKVHHCDDCGTQIKPGERYHRVVYVDGGIATWRTCLPCNAAALYVCDWTYADDDGIGPDTYAEWASEMAVHGEGDERSAARAYLARIGRLDGDDDA